MNRRDLSAGLFWLGISVFVCVLSIRSDVGTLHSPGPGFLPFWSAVFLGALSIILIIMSILGKRLGGKMIDLWKGLEWHKVVWVLFSLFLYPVILPITGYLITTFGFMLFLLCMMERSKAWILGTSALSIALISYLIFYILLDVKLPKGIFGF